MRSAGQTLNLNFQAADGNDASPSPPDRSGRRISCSQLETPISLASCRVGQLTYRLFPSEADLSTGEALKQVCEDPERVADATRRATLLEVP